MGRPDPLPPVHGAVREGAWLGVGLRGNELLLRPDLGCSMGSLRSPIETRLSPAAPGSLRRAASRSSE
eukprot:8772603-Pyramimonas_sp.AAC.1